MYSDVTSGSKEAKSRPGMQKLMSYAQNGDTIVVWRIDRLSRSLLDVLNTVNGLRDKGITVRSAGHTSEREVLCPVGKARLLGPASW